MPSGLVLAVAGLSPILGDLRDRYDPAARAGMPPHVTLLYPLPDELTPAQTDRVRGVVGGFRPLRLTFPSVERFPGLVWLAPQPASALLELMSAVHAIFPDHPPYEGQFEEVIPHLTVAQDPDETVLDQAERNLAERLRPDAVHAVAEVSLFTLRAGVWREIEAYRFG